MTKLLGVIGDPIHKSLSPVIHNHWYRQLGIGATYEAMHVPEGELEGALNMLSKRAAVGLNITLPHKHQALALSQTNSAIAETIGAANTLTRQADGTWHAENTDVPGFLVALESAYSDDLQGRAVTVLGAGGSARAVVAALASVGADCVILNRTVQKAKELAADLATTSSLGGPIDQYKEYLSDSTLVINTLSLGHWGEHLDLPVGGGRLFFDISYGSAASGQLSEAVNKGWRTEDGLRMLVEQAAESFDIWFGIRPDTEEALSRCRSLIEALQ